MKALGNWIYPTSGGGHPVQVGNGQSRSPAAAKTAASSQRSSPTDLTHALPTACVRGAAAWLPSWAMPSASASLSANFRHSRRLTPPVKCASLCCGGKSIGYCVNQLGASTSSIWGATYSGSNSLPPLFNAISPLDSYYWQNWPVHMSIRESPVSD